jgi:hypothetical protein
MQLFAINPTRMIFRAVLLQLHVKVSVGDAALRPVLLDDYVAGLGSKLWIKFDTPCSHLEGLGRQGRLMEHVHVLPPVKIAMMRSVMRLLYCNILHKVNT